MKENKIPDWKEFFTHPEKYIKEDGLKKIEDKDLLEVVNKLK